MLNNNTVAKVMAMLQVYFEVKEPPEKEMIKIYKGIFNQAGISDADLQKAAWMCCSSAKIKYGRLPTAAEILDHIKPDDDADALAAWTTLLKWRQQRNGFTQLRDREPSWDNYSRRIQTARRCVDVFGGWDRFCREKINEFKRRDFMNYYKIYSKDSSGIAVLPAAEPKALPSGFKE